jgi:hypothetical protein
MALVGGIAEARPSRGAVVVEVMHGALSLRADQR